MGQRIGDLAILGVSVPINRTLFGTLGTVDRALFASAKLVGYHSYHDRRNTNPERD